MSRDQCTKMEKINRMADSLRKYGMRTVLFQQNMADKMEAVPTDLKTAQILNETGAITAGELAAITGLSSGSVTALIRRLEEGGFIKKQKDPSDKRKVIITPEPDRYQGMMIHYQSLGRAVKDLCEKYTEEELDMLLSFVAGITNIMDKEIVQLMTERQNK